MADLRKGYWVELLPIERADGALAISLIAKRTFTIPIDQPVIEALEDDDQPPLLTEDRFDEGDVETAAPTLEHELVGEKAGVDVIVVGKAYAPGGKPLKEYECAIRVGDKLRRLRIVGPRRCRWLKPTKKTKEGVPVPAPPLFTEPTPVAVVTLSCTNAYGGQTWVIPDDETLKVQRTVQEVMAEEGREVAEQKAKAREKKKEAAEQAKKEAEEQAMLDAAVGALDDEDSKLLRARGQFGYDEEGVRLHGVATSMRGTAVMDVNAFEEWQVAQDKMMAEGRLNAEEKAALDAMRRNAMGEGLVIDDGVDILDEETLARELAQSAAEQEAAQRALAEAAARRRKDAVERNDGTAMIQIDGEEAEADVWEGDLRAELSEKDVAANAAHLAEIKERKKAEEEALAEFPKLPCPTNPFGKGFFVSPVRQIVDRLELPLIEDPDAPLTPHDLLQDINNLKDVPLPAGFSVLPRHATPRVEFAGEYPSELAGWADEVERQKRELDLEEEDDVAALREMDKRRQPGQMDRRWFNSAWPTMQLKFLAGDEEVTLTNLTKDGTLYFRLPARSIQAELDRGSGVERQDMLLDTLIIEPDERKVSLLWRAWFPMASWDELGEYPQMTGWVLDLDVKDKRQSDWEEAAARARADSTQVLDLNEVDLDPEDPYWRSISDKRKAAEAAAAAVEGTAALDIERMGLYRQVDDDDWVAEASDGAVDVAADKKKAAEEAAYLEKKQAAMKQLEAREKAEAERREEVAEAAAKGKPIPPKDADKSKAQLKAKAAKKAAANKKAAAEAKSRG